MDAAFISSIVIKPEEVDLRIDKLLSLRFCDYSRTYFQYLIENASVLLNKAPIKKKDKGKAGDEIEVFFLLSPEISLTPENIPLDILYEDEHIIAVNKPSGMVVHPAPGHANGTFVNALLFHIKKPFQAEEGLRPGIVHRLDKETSGVLLAAKNPLAHARLVRAFSKREIKKQYLAVCINSPSEGMINAPIGRNPKDRKKMGIFEKGKEALTEITILSKNEKMSLVLAKPVTGRTHQIRVHLNHLKAPVLGDSLYGNPQVNDRYGVSRQLLHAYSLSLSHPISGEQITLKAPFPEDIKNWIQKFSYSLSE